MPATATLARAHVGATVTYTDSVLGGEHTFKLAPAGHNNPIEGVLSIKSPVAAALEGLSVGESVELQSPALKQRTLTVTAVVLSD